MTCKRVPGASSGYIADTENSTHQYAQKTLNNRTETLAQHSHRCFYHAVLLKGFMRAGQDASALTQRWKDTRMYRTRIQKAVRCPAKII